MLEHHPAAITLELDQEEEDVKPPPSLIVELQAQEALEERDQEHMVHVMESVLLPLHNAEFIAIGYLE
uniref:Uncharacterized protein n=1 Tax=Sphaerodactylus townsendi TaxID=933632 RepID=A0ACB8FEC0_9SAUR